MPNNALPLWTAVALLLASPAARATAPEPDAPRPPTPAAGADLEALERAGYRVGKVELDIGDVFDESRPDERFVLFRLANRLHRTTRPEVIRRLLLFQPGDPLSAARVEESERLLRRERYFYDARIRPVRIDDDTVDLEVDTRDVWSLSASVGFHRSGGANATRFKVEDANLLGTGKELQAFYESNVDRTFGEALYRDRNLFGTRGRLELEAASASDGGRRRLVLERPFYALDARWATGVEVLTEHREDTLWDLGHATDRFATRQRFVEVYGGLSPGEREGRTRRWTTGVTWDELRFARPAATDAVGGFVPDDRRLVYPWIGWESVEDGYRVARDLDKIARSEDVNLGAHAAVRLGFAAAAWSSTEDAVVVHGTYGDGTALGEHHLFLVSAGLDGRYGDGHVHGLLGSVTARDLWTDFDRGRLMMALRFDFSRRLDADRQLLVGGDTGLRGYPLRFQPGDRILAMTVEQRVYDDREFFHLLRLGGAAFVDMARVWADERHATRQPYELLRDVGVGLRISSSRSARAAMIHFDVAWPFDGPSDRSHLQWLVTTSETF